MSAGRAFTVAAIAERLGARVVGDESVQVRGLASVEQARPGDLTFVSSAKYALGWGQSEASAAVVGSDVELPDDARPRLIVADVERAMIAALELFAIADDLPELGVHASATIDSSARIEKDVRIAANVTVGPRAQIGAGAILHAGVRVYADAVIGERTVLHANVVVRERCVIGRDVLIHQNVSIGADGFGYRPAPDGRSLVKMPHIGNVVIEDHVEIGANTCIDRAKFGSTVIGSGTKIDNLCQIAHNVRIGRMCVIAAQTGFSGSVTVGDGCMFGGQVGVADHLTIGDGAQIGAQSGLREDVPPGMRVVGSPAVEVRQAFRQMIAVQRLPELLRNIGRQGDSPQPGGSGQ